MRDKFTGQILAILAVLVVIGISVGMPSAVDVSKSDCNSSSAALYVLENEGYNATIRADNMSDGGICQVLWDIPGYRDILDPPDGQLISKPPNPFSVTILDHTMCKSLTSFGYPVDYRFLATWWHTKPSFYTDDKEAICWFELEGAKLGGSFTMKCYDPYDRLYATDTILVLTTPETEKYTKKYAGYLYISGHLAANMPGDWHIKLYYDPIFGVETLLFTEHFTISDRSKPIPTPKPTPTPTPTPTPSSIQSKIDAANPGDTILIKDGIYNENIKVNKRLTIRSENGADSTIVHATDSHIFNITADHVSIIGFTIEEASNRCGILISGVNNCNISNNIVSGNYQGIYLSNSSQNMIFNNNVLANKNNGIILTEGSTYNQIIKNNASNSLNGRGIKLVTSSDNNIIVNNTAKNNGNNGIVLKESNNNKIANNIADSNSEDGILCWTSSDNTLANNTCSNNDYDGIRLWSNSTNNILTNNIADSNSEAGILCWTSSDNFLTYNNLNSNKRGIQMYNYSTDNSVTNNTATANSYGISMIRSSNNNIYLNNFVDNTNNAYSSKSTNIWNSPLEITYTYKGTTYERYLGNYWSDYEEKYPDAEEIDSTGIWDTPYSIDGDKDNYPLMESFENDLQDFVSPSYPLNVSVTAAIDPVTPGGYSQVTVRVTTTKGTPLSDASVSVSATGGSLSPTSGTTDSKGEFKSTYTAPSVTTTQTDTISATASKAGYISGSGSDTITINYEPRRLLTGTFIVKKLSGGRGELTIENGLSSDAVVVLSKSTRPKIALMSVYLQSENTYTITGIPDGVYILYYSFGEDWDSNSKKFTVTQTYGRFKEELEFKTTTTGTHIDYTGYAATLHPVPGGTAKTEHVSEADFPE